jgi:hypothetical protein
MTLAGSTAGSVGVVSATIAATVTCWAWVTRWARMDGFGVADMLCLPGI